MTTSLMHKTLIKNPNTLVTYVQEEGAPFNQRIIQEMHCNSVLINNSSCACIMDLHKTINITAS